MSQNEEQPKDRKAEKTTNPQETEKDPKAENQLVKDNKKDNKLEKDPKTEENEEEEENPLEKLLAIENFFFGTMAAGSILFVVLGIFALTMGPKMQFHFLVMMGIDMLLLLLVIYFYPAIKHERLDYMEREKQKELAEKEQARVNKEIVRKEKEAQAKQKKKVKRD